MKISSSWSFFLLICGFATTALTQESQRLYPAANVVVGSTQPAFEALLDMDGDGDLDAVGALFGMGLSNLGLYQNDGTGRFSLMWGGTTVGLLYGTVGEVSVGDFDGDGRDDFLVTTGAQIVPFLGNGFGAPTQLTPLVASGPPSLPIRKTRIVDLNADGLDDLVILLRDSLGVVVTAPGGGAPFMNVFAFGGYASGLAVVAHPDGSHTALISEGTLLRKVRIENAGATLTGLPSITLGVDPMLTSGDVDGDGDQDAVAFGMTSFQVLRQGAGNALALEALRTGGPATALADVDLDGDLDGVCCGGGGGPGLPLPNLSLNSNFEVSINDGVGGFAPAFQIPGYGARHIAGAADLDADGDVDLIAGRAIFFSKGLLTQDPLLRYTAPPGLSFNDWTYRDGDGDGDIDPGSDIESALRNDGSGQLAEFVPTLTGALAGAIDGSAGGDFDGDGDQDYLVSYGYPLPFAALGMYLATQSTPGVFTVGGLVVPLNYSFLTPAGPFHPYAEDLNGDGLADLLVTTELPIGVSVSVDTTSLYFNLGGGAFASPVSYPVTVKAIVDLDADLRADLVVATYQSGLGWVRNLGAGAFAAPQWFGVPMGSSRSDRIAVADIDSDGDQDILAPSITAPFTWKSVTLVRNDGSGALTPVTGLFPNVGAYQNADPRTIVRVSDLDHNGALDVLITPAFDTLGSTAILMASAPLVFEAPRVHVMTAELSGDLNGDGAIDIVRAGLSGGSTLLCDPRGAVAPGDYVQYGSLAAGSGGFVPLLGAKGPFRTGETVKVTLRGGVGGTPAIFAIGTSRLGTPIPWPPSHGLYLDPASPSTWLLPITLGGAAGVTGAGSIALDFYIPPSLAGIELHHQAAVVDPANPTGLALSNAFRITYGG